MRTIIFFFLLTISQFSYGQIFGTITDENGDTLAFADVIIAGTSNGTSSNSLGYYELKIPKGKVKIVFQFLGYELLEKEFEVEKKVEFNPVLRSLSLSLSEVEVVADKEDPAYEIIRNAREKRSYYKKLMPKYECDVYIKGFQEVRDVPEKIMGMELGDMGGVLDSTRSGIVYLSESLSKYYKNREETKEELVFSKVSGNSSGISFNRAKDIEFEMYKEYIPLGGMKNILSPLASNTFQFYRFKLLGMYYENGHGIYTIKVIPKNGLAPLFSGIININDELWNINSVDFRITGNSIGIPILDTLELIQSYIPLSGGNKWALFSQNLKYDLNFLGIKMKGFFKAVYTNYNEESSGAKFEKNQVFGVKEHANEVTEMLWDSLRPIPLTSLEKIDYIRKDSIHEVRTSKNYLDSIDNVNNKFKLKSIFLAYSNSNSYKKSYWSIGSPLMRTNFNPVQGLNSSMSFTYRKNKDVTGYNRTRFRIGYGFGDKKIELQIQEKIKFDDIKKRTLELRVGSKYNQLGKTMIKPLDTYYVLYKHMNYRPVYRTTFGQVLYSQELFTGLNIRSNLGLYKRCSVENVTEFSFRNKEKVFTPNELVVGDLGKEEYIKIGIGLSFTPSMKYSLTSKSKNYQGSKWPNFYLDYTTAMPLNYHKMVFGVKKHGIEFGISGYSDFMIEGGKVFSESLYFADYFHFKGNIIFVMKTSFDAFHSLPYFEYSTSDNYIQGHYIHHFDGLLLSRIPLMKKLLFKSLVGYKTLIVPNKDQYHEVFAGVENIGWGMYRFLRVDFTASFVGKSYQSFGVTLGFAMNGISISSD